MTSANLETPVEAIMTAKVHSVHPTDALEDAARMLLDHHISGMPVVDDKGAVVGVVTLTDMAKRMGHGGADGSDGTVFYGNEEIARLLEALVVEGGSIRGVVGDVMSKKVIAVGASTTIREAARRMVAERIHRVIVVSDAGALIGIVSTLDVVDHLSR